MEKERTFEIDWNGGKAEVTVKRLTFGEKLEVRKASVQARMIGGKEHFIQDEKNGVLTAMLLGIKKAPFEVTSKGIMDLDGSVGELILENLKELNELTEAKKSS